MEDIIKQLQALAAEYGLQVVGAIATIIIGIWIAKLISKFVGRLLKKKDVDETLSKFLVSLVK
ncbi:MAG: mechanosensitive ion channel family protein, partial [Ignavibacteria bacterium]|nr:mechanosensitive ion channel family protein [Ignavibacteria bacterium]